MGKGGLETTKLWYSDIERLLEGLRFCSEEMVTLAALTLRDLAYTWWKGVLRAKRARYIGEGCQDPGMRWHEFTTLFHDRWVGYAAKDTHQVEIDILVEGSMSRADYGHRFKRLVQHVPPYQDMEEEEAKRFIRGIRSEINRYLVTLGITTFHEAVQKGLLIEREELRAKTTPSQPKMGKKGLGRQGLNKKTSRTDRFHRFTSGQGSSQPIRPCPQCGKTHEGTCYRQSGCYFRCGAADHWVQETIVQSRFHPRAQLNASQRRGTLQGAPRSQ